MSDKIETCGYRTSIDQFLRDGKSTRFISTWLKTHGVHVSHVTIAAYKNEGHRYYTEENNSTSEPNESISADPQELPASLLQQAVNSQNNPSKLRAYVDAYVKLQGRVDGRNGPVPPPRDSICDENLSRPERLEKLKGLTLNILKFYHPCYSSSENSLERYIELRPEFDHWYEGVKDIMEPIFRGELPTETEPVNR